MSRTHWDRVDAIFAAALALPAEARAEYVAEASGSDRTLQAEVHALLEAAEASDALFGEDDQVRARLLMRAFTREAPLEPGRQVGAYRILAPLGVGGMGAVYLAERADGQFEQRVAVKLVNTPLVRGAEMVERFLRERQILARLEHPNIARLLDGGVTEDGWPYLVMEYVDGVPLTAFCEERKLPVDRRIRLLQDVGRAVQYAHRNLVVHRDLKPSNILVTPDGMPKLLDFGIAKLLEEGHDGELTLAGGGMMTPGYAAPEQLRSEPVTTAADVYALGVLLVKLLTGHKPDGDTDIPSGRLPVDLDRISRMALRDEPERRYESAQAFVDDLERYRECRPVTARPDTLGYKTRRFVARNRALVAAAVLVALAMAGGLGAALWQADIARVEAARAGEVRDFMLDLFEGTDPELATGEAITIQELLARASERVERELASQPWLQAEMFTLVGSIYGRLGQYDDGRRLLGRAVALHESTVGPGSAPHALAILELARIEHRAGEWEGAQALYLEAQNWLEQAAGPWSVEVGRVYHDRALLAHGAGRYGEADSLFTMSRETLAHGADSLEVLLLDLSHIGTLHTLGDTERIEQVYARIVNNRSLLDDERSATVAHAMFGLGVESTYRGDAERAERLLRGALELRRKVYGDEHREVAITLMALATVSGHLGRWDEALALSREGVQGLRETLGPAHPDYAMHLGALAVMVGNYAGDAETALDLFREVEDIQVAALGEGHLYVAMTRRNLGRSLMGLERHEEARPVLEAGLSSWIEAMGDEGFFPPEIRLDLAETHAALEQDDEADRLLRAVIDGFEDVSPRAGAWGQALMVQARILDRRGEHRQAAAALRDALERHDADGVGEASLERARAQSDLGRVLTTLEQFAEAEELLRRAHETFVGLRGTRSPDTRLARERLTRLYRAWGRPADADRVAAGGD